MRAEVVTPYGGSWNILVRAAELPCQRQLIERHRPVGGHAQDCVDQVSASLDLRHNSAEQLELFLSEQIASLEQHDAVVKVACRGKVLEVRHVRGDNDTILFERLLEDLPICGLEEASVAYAAGVDAFGSKCCGDSWREVLIEQELDVHEAGPSQDTPERRAARTRGPHR